MNKAFPRVNKIAAILVIEKAKAELVKSILTGEISANIFKGTSNGNSSSGAAINNKLEAINTIIEGFGVEAGRQLNIAIHPYWMDTRFIYINRGDACTMTIVYDVITDRFYFTSWGDFVEKAQAKGAKFP